MRVLVAAALIATSVAGVSAARAADLPSIQSGGYSTRDYAVGGPAEPLVVYDFEPGVVVRPYWLAPWRHRHYFPATGMRPKIGRKENLSARSSWKPAESYYRFWSTSSAFLPEQPRGRVRGYDVEPAPHMAPPRK